MKSTAEKSSTTTSSSAQQAASQPFFAKAGAGGFFETPVQTKLTVGQPGDRYEKEADGMANKVVQRSETPNIQLKCNDCEKDKAQRKPLADSITPWVPTQKEEERKPAPPATGKISTKLETSAPMAEEKEKPVQRQTEAQPAGPETEEKPDSVQAKTVGGPTPTADIEGRLTASKGQGHPLPEATRTDMEVSFGVDFGQVRIHTGSTAVDMSKSLHAQAFTHGSDIYFNEGKYNPATREGKTLLAHELTHTVQQGAAVRRKPDLAAHPAPHIQREEVEVDDPQRELALSDKAAKDAIDPGPAQRTRAVAVEVQAQTAKKAQSKHAKKKGSGGQKAGKKPGGASAATKKAKAAALAAKEDAFKETLGTVGKDLSDGSAFACAKADEKTGDLAVNEQTHDNADQKQQQTDGAVVPPAQEGQAMGNTEQVAGLDAAAPPQPDKEAAKQAMTEAMTEAMPKSIEEVNEFESQGKAQVVGNQVLGAVSADVGEVQDKYNDIEQPPAAKPVEQATELPAEEVAPGTSALHLGKGAVPALDPKHTDVTAIDNQSDDLLQKEGIPEDQLNMVDSGDLGEAKKERKDLKKKVVEQPAKIKQEAKKETQQVEKDLQQEETAGKAKMRDKRKGGLTNTRDKQQKTKTELEKKREAVTAKINGIYERAKTSVTTKLGNLEKQNLVAFDKGQQAASTTFEREVKRDINAWKRERYSGAFAGLKWLKDALVGIDEFPEVKQALDRGRERYVQNIDKLIADIDRDNQRVIKECKQELSAAQKEIQDYVKTLGPELKATGQAALKEMKSKLAEMDKFIDEQKDKLREKLCSKREEAIKAIDKKIEQMKEAMSGALSKLGNLILEALVKFFKWALEKAGYPPGKLMEIINKGKVVLKKIVTSPGEFFSNLAKAVKGGVENFKTNIEKHLITGMMGWLTGAMSDSGLQLPATWDLKGIFYLLLQILNLTKESILKKLSLKIGFDVMQVAGEVGDFVKRVMAEGPMALWDMLKEQADMLKEKVLAAVRNWISVEMIKQGIIKLVSMLNPVGAIVQLIIGIYNAVMFFVENWSRIVEFVKTIFNSIADIALGRLSGAMTSIEKALGLTIPIILNFISRLLGLSGIGKAVRKAIEAVRAPIDKIVDQGLTVVAGLVKKLVAGVKKGIKKGKEKVVAVKDKLLAWWKNKIAIKTADGESHTLYFKGEQDATAYLASRPRPVKEFLAEVEKSAGKNSPMEPDIKAARKILDKISDLSKERKSAAVNIKGNASIINAKAAEISQLFKDLGGIIAKLTVSGEIMSDAEMAEKPRKLPQGFDVRNALYTNGSGYNSIKGSVKEKGIAQIKSDIDRMKDKTTGEHTARVIWAGLVNKGQVFENDDRKTINISDIKKENYDVDHTIPLARHWIEKGHNTDDGERFKMAGGIGNLQVMLSHYNRQAQADGFHYNQDDFKVGKDFVSVYNNSVRGSKKIKGQNFEFK